MLYLREFKIVIMIATQTDTSLILSGYSFSLYNLDNFDFNEKIELNAKDDSRNGVYVFTYAYNAMLTEGVPYAFKMAHQLLYLGKADSIEERPLSPSHNKWERLKLDGCNRFGVYFCKENEDPKEIESYILKDYNFKENIAENENNIKDISIVMEV